MEDSAELQPNIANERPGSSSTSRFGRRRRRSQRLDDMIVDSDVRNVLPRRNASPPRNIANDVRDEEVENAR